MLVSQAFCLSSPGRKQKTDPPVRQRMMLQLHGLVAVLLRVNVFKEFNLVCFGDFVLAPS